MKSIYIIQTITPASFGRNLQIRTPC